MLQSINVLRKFAKVRIQYNLISDFQFSPENLRKESANNISRKGTQKLQLSTTFHIKMSIRTDFYN